jgi:hypothetical protein
MAAEPEARTSGRRVRVVSDLAPVVLVLRHRPVYHDRTAAGPLVTPHL